MSLSHLYRSRRALPCKAPSASPAAVPQPTFDQPPSVQPRQCPSSQQPLRPQHRRRHPVHQLQPQHPVTLPAPLPQPPVLPWQMQCIQQPVPLEQLEEFFVSQDIAQNSPPEEQSTLAHAVARDMDAVQQADHIKEQTWHKMEVEKRRRTMAQ